MIEDYFSHTIFRLRNSFLGAVVLASLLWAVALANPASAQAYTDESWIQPETISSGLAHVLPQ